MSASIWVDSILFQNGVTLQLKSNSIVVFVGPNNAGKSKTLEEINNLCRQGTGTGLIVNSVSISKQGTASEFLDRVKGNKTNNLYHTVENIHSTNSTSETDMITGWNSYDDPKEVWRRTAINKFLVKRMSTSERLGLVNPPQIINFLTEAPKHPIHHLKVDDAKQSIFS